MAICDLRLFVRGDLRLKFVFRGDLRLKLILRGDLRLKVNARGFQSQMSYFNEFASVFIDFRRFQVPDGLGGWSAMWRPLPPES